MNTTTQMYAHYGRKYALATVVLATLAVPGSAGTANIRHPAMDVSAITTTIDVSNLPVHNITDAY